MMEMSVSALAAAAVSLLAPYLAKAGEVAAAKAGDAAWKKVTEIYDAVKTRFGGEKDEHLKQTLTRFEERPEARKGSMQEALEEVLSEDPQFAQKLAVLLQESERAGAGAIFNTNVFGGKVGNISNFGNVEGNVDIG